MLKVFQECIREGVPSLRSLLLEYDGVYFREETRRANAKDKSGGNTIIDKGNHKQIQYKALRFASR